MIITSEQLKQIAGAGGSLVLDASTWTFNQLREIITAAAAGNAQITLHKLSGLTAAELRELAMLAPRLITFDLTG
jgi:hypothetical protein